MNVDESMLAVVCDNNDCYYKRRVNGDSSTVDDEEEEAAAGVNAETLFFLVNQSKYFPQEYLALCNRCATLLTEVTQCYLCTTYCTDQWVCLFGNTHYCRECAPDQLLLSFPSMQRNYSAYEAATLFSARKGEMRKNVAIDALKLLGTFTHSYRKERLKQHTKKRDYEAAVTRIVSKWMPSLSPVEALRVTRRKRIDEGVMNEVTQEKLDTLSGYEFITWLMNNV